MRMARMNISLPDDLVRRAKETGVNVSHLARKALEEEFDRLDKIAAVDQYLAEVEAEQGPITPEEEARAQAFYERIYGPGESRRSA